LKEKLPAVFFLCFVSILFPTILHGEEIGLDSSWQYNGVHSGETDDISSFNQRYGVQWNPRVTRAILLNSNINYSKSITTGNLIRETISPTGSLQVDNDIFFAEINGMFNQSRNSQSHNQINRNLESVLASNWDYDYWPNLSVTLGQNWLNDGEEIPLTDSTQKWSEFILKWELDTFESYYSYFTQIRDNAVEKNSYEENRHFGRLDYDKSFFKNTFTLNLSAQLTNSTTDFISYAEGVDGVSIKIGASQTMAGVNPLPLSGRVPNSSALMDGNTNSTAFTIKLHEVANIGIKTDLQAVDFLYVYTGQIDPLLLAETGSLSWDLYSSDDGLNWHLEVANAPTQYNADLFRYRVNTGSIERIYLKLVATAWPPTLAIPITEIEAYRNQEGRTVTGEPITDNQEYTRTLLDTNFRYTPTSDISLNYSLIYDDTVSLPGNDRRRIFQTGNINYQYSPYLHPSFSVNDTATNNTSIADTSQRTYALTIQSIFLSSLETTFSLTRSENATDNVLQSTNDAIHLTLTAALYPDLDSRLELTSNFNQNAELDRSTDNLNLRWTLTSRLRNNLLVDFIWEHGTTGISLSEIISSPQSGGQGTLNINWRPSDLVSIQLNGSQGYGEAWASFNNLLFDASVTVVRTSKTSVILGYRANSSEGDTVNGLTANWSWNLSEFFTMQSLANYIVSQEQTGWLINTRLTARF
jgi:hypothetical protein